MPNYFTVEEATALLPRIRPILEEIVSLRDQLTRAERDLVALHWKARTNGHARQAGSFAAGQAARADLIARVNAQIARVRELGVELKDPTIGLIDFPAWRDGRVVYLCWKLGEPAIMYWHDLDTGFAGRQPL
jgi:hypothetical protein